MKNKKLQRVHQKQVKFEKFIHYQQQFSYKFH
jgi:hypothetical protein